MQVHGRVFNSQYVVDWVTQEAEGGVNATTSERSGRLGGVNSSNLGPV